MSHRRPEEEGEGSILHLGGNEDEAIRHQHVQRPHRADGWVGEKRQTDVHAWSEPFHRFIHPNLVFSTTDLCFATQVKNYHCVWFPNHKVFLNYLLGGTTAQVIL